MSQTLAAFAARYPNRRPSMIVVVPAIKDGQWYATGIEYLCSCGSQSVSNRLFVAPDVADSAVALWPNVVVESCDVVDWSLP